MGLFDNIENPNIHVRGPMGKGKEIGQALYAENKKRVKQIFHQSIEHMDEVVNIMIEGHQYDLKGMAFGVFSNPTWKGMMKYIDCDEKHKQAYCFANSKKNACFFFSCITCPSFIFRLCTKCRKMWNIKHPEKIMGRNEYMYGRKEKEKEVNDDAKEEI